MRPTLRILLGSLLLISPFICGIAAESPPPNVVIILADDLGFHDLGCFGATDLETPNLDRLAEEGIRFSSFYAAQAVCSASRAALLTGCYPNRIGIQGALGPGSKTGISASEITLAELLKQKEYATAIYGKWHLGDHRQFLPLQHGFDDYFGLPYSNDMWPHHPTAGTNYPPLPLLEGNRIMEFMPDQRFLTRRYTEKAIQFIRQNKNRPFFLYLAHSMPHVPLFIGKKPSKDSARGLYGDVIHEIDWSVGQILQTLRKNRLDDHTLVVFTSDNGPWLLYGNHAGSAIPLREGKGTTFEGGMRVPCLMRWPGKIPPGALCRELTATIDLLPTIAYLAGVQLPADRVVDGKNIWPLMAQQPNARSPHEAFFYYWGNHLQAVRSGSWKLHFPHSYVQPNPAGSGGKPGTYRIGQIAKMLFNLDADIGETTNVADLNPQVVARLEALAEQTRTDLGDDAVHRQGAGARPPGLVTP